MICLLQNHLARSWSKKTRFILMFLLIAVSLLLAVFLSNSTKESITIATINQQGAFKEESLTIKEVKKAPKLSELVMGKYDAVIDFSTDKPQITTIKNQEFEDRIKNVLSGQQMIETNTTLATKKVQKIFGYMLLFVLMCAMTNTFLYSEDKERTILPRIMCSGSSLVKLESSYLLFLFVLVFLPTFILITILIKGFQFDLGTSLVNYAILLAMLCIIGVSYALFNASFFKSEDQSNMIGSMILVITSLMSGSFFSVTTTNDWWKKLTDVLPQKQFLNLVQSIGEGHSYQENLQVIMYLLGLSGLFIGVSMLKNKKMYVR